METTEKKLLESPAEVTSVEVMRQKRAEVRRHCFLVSLGVCLLYSGYSATLVLQTSINIENGTGSVVTSIAYINAVLVSFLVPANLARFLGVKNTMIFSEFCYVIYLFGNLTSNRAALQVGAIIAGFGDAIFWIPFGLLIVFFGKRYKKYSPEMEEHKCFAIMSGIMFPMYQLNTILGNAVVYFVLKTTSSTPVAVEETNSTATTTNMTSQTSDMTRDYIRFCGANDCQNANITSAQIDLYVPRKGSIYMFISCLIVIQLTGILLHCKFIPKFQLHQVNRDEGDEGEKLTNIWQLTSTIVTTFKLFFFNVNQWLLFIPGFYLGLSVGFFGSEISRAFASCTLGVANIGGLVVVHSVVYSTIQSLWSKLMAKKGRVYVMLLWPIFDVTLYLICLLWAPNRENAAFVVVLLFVIEGVALSANQLVISLFYSLIFPNNLEISFIFWNISFFCGYSMQFGWSQYLCVYTKIYVGLAVLFLAVFFLFVLNNRLNQERKGQNLNVTSSSQKSSEAA